MALKVILIGTDGKMGREISSLIVKDTNFHLVEKITKNNIHSLPRIASSGDLIIDFSSPSALHEILQTKKPLVIGTTGYSNEQFEQIKHYSKKYPVLYSANFSIGIATLILLLQKVTQIFPFTSIDILDAHNAKKVDAPSGTALLLEKAIKKRVPISHHSIRGGTIIADHDIIMHCENETIKLSHSAKSRAVFAKGALLATQYIIKKKSGLYNLLDLIQE